MNLQERIQELVHRVGSQRLLSEKAGLSERYVGVTLLRLKENPDTRLEGKTIAHLASAAGVSARWLLTGEGSPDDDPGPLVDHSLDQSEPGRPAIAYDTDSVFGNMSNWPALYAAARAKRPSHPQWVWDATAESRPQLPGVDPTVHVVVLVSDIVLELVAPPPPGTRDGRAYYRQVMRDMSTNAFRNLAAHAAKNNKP